MADSPPEDEREPVEKRPCEVPRIIWSEPCAPTTLGVSCAKQPGAYAPFFTNA